MFLLFSKLEFSEVHRMRENHFPVAESEQITYQVTTSQSWFQNNSHIFVSGTGSAFSEVRKSESVSAFFLLSKQALLVPETKIWDLFWNQICDVVTW